MPHAVRNVLESAEIPGQTPPQKENVPESAEIPGQTPLQKENVLESPTKPGETTAAEEICPGNNYNFGRNSLSGRKSWGNGEKIWLTPQLSLLSRAQNFFLRLYILFNPLVVN